MFPFFVDLSRAWWLRPPLPSPACPIGYVEVHGCLPVGKFNQGPGKPGPVDRSPPQEPPAAPPPPPHSCPTGFKWSNVFGGCVFDNKKKSQKQAAPE